MTNHCEQITSIEMDYDWQKLVIDWAILAYDFLHLALFERLRFAVLRGDLALKKLGNFREFFRFDLFVQNFRMRLCGPSLHNVHIGQNV